MKRQPPEDFYEDIQKIVAASEQIYQQAERAFIPMVDSLIQSNCTDFLKIDKLLDDLLSFACNDRILLLFKKICRYYYPINPEVVAYYVDAYRKMWDEEDIEPDN